MKPKKHKQTNLNVQQSPTNLIQIQIIEERIKEATDNGKYEISFSSSVGDTMNADIIKYFKKKGYEYIYFPISSDNKDIFYAYNEILSWSK